MPRVYELRDYTLGTGTTQDVPAVPVWLFLVDDGDSRGLAGSAEDGAAVKMARVDLEDPGSATWQEVITPATFGAQALYPSLADHWHIWAHGSHWIAVSLKTATGDAEGVGLVQLDEDFTVQMAGVVFGASGGNWTVNPTNDLYVVETSDGVAIGIGDMSGSLESETIIRVSAATWIPAVVDLQGVDASLVEFINLASARYDADAGTIRIVAPRFASACTASHIQAVEVTQDITAVVQNYRLLESSSFGFIMPMEADLPGGLRALVVVAAPIVAVGDPCDEYGKIMLLIFDETETIISTVPVAPRGLRPHVYYHAPYVVVCYDDDTRGDNSTLSCHVWKAELEVEYTIDGARFRPGSLFDSDFDIPVAPGLLDELLPRMTRTRPEFLEVLPPRIEVNPRVLDDPPFPPFPGDLAGGFVGEVSNQGIERPFVTDARDFLLEAIDVDAGAYIRQERSNYTRLLRSRYPQG